MAKKLGNDYRLWVESATAGVYNEVKGGQSLSVSQSGSTIDTSTKDNFPFGTQAPGLRSVSISAEMIPDLPDANGFTRLESLANASSATPVNIQIRKGGSAGVSPGDVVYAGGIYVTEWNQSYGMNDAVKATATLVAASAPTTNTLA